MKSGAYDGTNRNDYFQGVGQWFAARKGVIREARSARPEL
jgi:hypothetical protein